MGSAFNKEIVRSIAQSAGRFAAIAIISLLGAGFYAGLRMAAPDMMLAGDEFFDGANLYDISVITTLGVDDDIVDMLSNVEGVGAVMPARHADAMVRLEEGSYAASIESLPLEAANASHVEGTANVVSDDDGYLNRPILVEGDWPAVGSSDECVVGVDAARELGVSIGSTLEVEKVSDDSEVDDTFESAAFRVVGLVNSAAYAATNVLGTTSLGTGSVELYLYVGKAAFADGIPYSTAYLTVPDARGLVWGSPEYDEAVGRVKREIEALSDDIATSRLDAVKHDLHFQVLGLVQELSADLGWADDIEKPEVYVIDRSKNPGAAALKSDAEGISKIATFIPFMFFLVAALVSLTSMTRMVDEERVVIGTHKALGYGSGRITSKYLIYCVLASGLGSVIGIVGLGKILPWFIMTSYQVTYAVPVVPLPIHPDIAARALGLSVGVTALATWWAAAATLRAKPAALMLPRVPKAGKRIILEHIGPLWRRFSFSQKVTARNLLRYKRRFFMAVVGVMGCTALLMIGFGLRDVIGGIVDNQYNVLMSYDAAVRLDEDISKPDRAAAGEVLVSVAGEDGVLLVDDFNMIAKGVGEDMRVEVVVPSDLERFGSFVTLRNRGDGEPIALDDAGVVLTEKAARVLGVSVGDEVQLFDENDVGDATGDGRQMKVVGVSENYLGHYAYLTPAGYRAAFEEEPAFDLAYVKLAPDVDTADFSAGMLGLPGVNTVSFVAEKVVTYQDMLDIMNKLIFIVVLFSAALAFVVLYNLTNINITERVREIATLKVLGFTRREVNVYMFREVIIMTLIGAFVGCIAGGPAALYIAEAAETSNMMFGQIIAPMSYVASFALTMVFAVIVAFTMRGKLVRVNMVESLKSVE